MLQILWMLWEALGGFGRLWEALGCSGMLRDAQGCSDMFLIDRFETFWVNSSSYFIGMGCCRFYGCFGRLWEALGGFGMLRDAQESS